MSYVVVEDNVASSVAFSLAVGPSRLSDHKPRRAA